MTRRRVVRSATRIIILLVMLSIVAWGCADRIILGSNHDQVDPGTARAHIIKVEGRALQCWIAQSPAAQAGQRPQAFVLFFVGKGDRADRWIDAVAGAWGEHPVEVWGVNYPGSGASDGPAKLINVPPSALAVYDDARKIAGTRPIFIHAGSFGTTAALYVAANRQVAGLVLQNPPPLRQLILGHYGWWNLWIGATPVAMSVPNELDSLANAGRVNAPAIFISAGSDGLIPASYHRQVIDAYAGPKRVIEMPGAGRDTPLTKEAAQAFAKDLAWLWQGASSHAATARAR